MKKIMIVMLLIGGFSTLINAKTLKGGYGACLSESAYDEWNKTDTTGMKYLIKSQKCFILKSGIEYSMVHYDIGSSIIRVYFNGNGLKVWTANENFE